VDLALACGVGDIALGACVMAMPIAKRPSCLTCPSAREALVLLSLIPLSRLSDDFEMSVIIQKPGRLLSQLSRLAQVVSS
jgi:hypothetical protein